MSKLPSAFLVARRDDGFGDVYPLHAGTRYTVGRAVTSKIALKDDLCSREHSEVFPDGEAWSVRDLGSLNGTHVNGEPVRGERSLRPMDEVRLGRTRLVFVDELGQLPDVPQSPTPRPDKSDGLEIRKRLGQTRYQPQTIESDEDTHAEPRVAPPQAV